MNGNAKKGRQRWAMFHIRNCNCDACQIRREEDFVEMEKRSTITGRLVDLRPHLQNIAPQSETARELHKAFAEPLPPGEYTCTTEDVFDSIFPSIGGPKRGITQALVVDAPDGRKLSMRVPIQPTAPKRSFLPPRSDD